MPAFSRLAKRSFIAFWMLPVGANRRVRIIGGSTMSLRSSIPPPLPEPQLPSAEAWTLRVELPVWLQELHRHRIITDAKGCLLVETVGRLNLIHVEFNAKPPFLMASHLST